MRWAAEGIVISTKRYGERSKIISIFTRDHGLYSGLRARPKALLQAGDLVHSEWSAKDELSLGFFECELLRSTVASIFRDFERLVALNSAMSVLLAVLPQRQEDEVCYDRFLDFILGLADGQNWRRLYIRLELTLLERMGFGLSLSECAVSGSKDSLSYISPRTGRAVSEDAAGPYKDKLLPFPVAFKYLQPEQDFCLSNQHFAKALKVTEYFLRRHLLKFVPLARKQILSLALKQVNTNTDGGG
ncbi:DNA repair protein RecO [Rickettsiales bacterium]|nr:DNA repair protein RecO [Rickettsiales bacterium]